MFFKIVHFQRASQFRATKFIKGFGYILACVKFYELHGQTKFIFSI